MTAGPRFQRNIEDFTCVNCGAVVQGNGYTNHCPVCLYSLHVDVMPGDRASECGGVMRPVGIDIRAKGTQIIHVCQKCGFRRATKTVPGDSQEALRRVSAATELPGR